MPWQQNPPIKLTFLLPVGTSLSRSGRCWEALHGEAQGDNDDMAQLILKAIVRAQDERRKNYVEEFEECIQCLEKAFDTLCESHGADVNSLAFQSAMIEFAGEQFLDRAWEEKPTQAYSRLLSAELSVIHACSHTGDYKGGRKDLVLLVGDSNLFEGCMTWAILKHVRARAVSEEMPYGDSVAKWFKEVDAIDFWGPFAWDPYNSEAYAAFSKALANSYLPKAASTGVKHVLVGGYKAVIMELACLMADADAKVIEDHPHARQCFDRSEILYKRETEVGQYMPLTLVSGVPIEEPRYAAPEWPVFQEALDEATTGQLYVMTTGASLLAFSRCWTSLRRKDLDAEREHQLYSQSTYVKQVVSTLNTMKGAIYDAPGRRPPEYVTITQDAIGRARNLVREHFDASTWTNPQPHLLSAELATLRAMLYNRDRLFDSAPPPSLILIGGQTNAPEALLTHAVVEYLKELAADGKLSEETEADKAAVKMLQHLNVQLYPALLDWEPSQSRDHPERGLHEAGDLLTKLEDWTATHGKPAPRYILTGGYKNIIASLVYRLRKKAMSMAPIRPDTARTAYYLYSEQDDPGPGSDAFDLVTIKLDKRRIVSVDRTLDLPQLR